MIYNNRSRSNDATESQKEITRLSKMWSLKRLVMLKYESGTSLTAVQYK